MLQSSAMQAMVDSASVRTLLVMYSFQHDVQNLCSHMSENVSVWPSSKQIGHTNGCDTSTTDAPRFELFDVFVASAAERRAVRVGPVDDWRLEDAFGGGGVGSRGGHSTPAATAIWEALSMYLSVSFSLFQIMYRSSWAAMEGYVPT